MTYEQLKGRKAGRIEDKAILRYAVVCALVEVDGQDHVLFEKRSEKLKRQPGEICFPGGKRDGDESALENAVRETVEELAVGRDQVEVIAQMDTMATVYNNEVDVFLVRLHDYQMTFGSEEVEEVFTVPLTFFLENEPDIYQNKVRIEVAEDFPLDKIPGGRGYKWRTGRQNVYFYEYEGRIIWGLTAYIMHSVVDIMKKECQDGQ